MADDQEKVCGHTHDEWAAIPHVRALILGIGPCGFCFGHTGDPEVCIPQMIPSGWVRNPALDKLRPAPLGPE